MMKGLELGGDVEEYVASAICFINSRYLDRGRGLYPNVLSEAFSEGVEMAGSPAVVEVLGLKKVYWWTEGSFGKPLRREVLVVTAPVYGQS
jgi:hypothetical protein